MLLEEKDEDAMRIRVTRIRNPEHYQIYFLVLVLVFIHSVNF